MSDLDITLWELAQQAIEVPTEIAAAAFRSGIAAALAAICDDETAAAFYEIWETANDPC